MAATGRTQLGSFQKTVDDMRTLIHCQICLKPFYEPYTLACGHTYCYSCLTSWCTGGHNRGRTKNCPDCRAPINSQPSPNYTVRDLVQLFLSRTELLPEDETVQEHVQAKEQEARTVANDKAGQGLFKGLFKSRRFMGGIVPPRVILDHEDGVERCPNCTWELEAGECFHCGYNMSDDSELDESIDVSSVDYESYEDDRDVSPVDQFGGPVDIPVPPPVVGGVYGQVFNHAHFSEDEDSEGYTSSADGPRSPHYYEDEDDGEMDDFIDDEVDEDAPDEVDDDDASVETVQDYTQRRPYGTTASPTQREDPRLYDSESEDDSTDDESSVAATETTGATTNDDATTTNADDSDDSSVEEIPVSMMARPSRKRRVIDSDDEDSEDEEQTGFSSEESDDTAIQAPQAAAAHRGHLRQRVRRHSNPSHRNPVIEIPSDSPQPQYARRGGSSFRGRPHNVVQVARRGRPAATRVH